MECSTAGRPSASEIATMVSTTSSSTMVNPRRFMVPLLGGSAGGTSVPRHNIACATGLAAWPKQRQLNKPPVAADQFHLHAHHVSRRLELRLAGQLGGHARAIIEQAPVISRFLQLD